MRRIATELLLKGDHNRLCRNLHQKDETYNTPVPINEKAKKHQRPGRFCRMIGERAARASEFNQFVLARYLIFEMMEHKDD